MRLGLAVLCWMMTVSGLALGANVQFEATVSSSSVTLDQTLELTVTLARDGSLAVDSYRPPATPDFDVLHAGTSQQIQSTFLGGRSTVRMVEEHAYVLRPRKKGALTIGPATIRAGGQEFHTKPVTVQVAPPSKNALTPVVPAPGQPGVQSPGQPSGTGTIGAPPRRPGSDAQLFIDAQVDKTSVYVGEQVLLSWRLFTLSELLKYRTLAEPKHEDFWAENLYAPTGYLSRDVQTVQGRDYAVSLLMKKALFPLKAGRLTITPLEAEATTLETAFNPTGSGLLRSPPVVIEVKPLPAAGRPPTFDSANVGRFQLTAALDRARVKAGEAVTWTVILRGSGNVRGARLQWPTTMDGIKVYDPTIKETIEPADEVHGEKAFVFLLKPERGGRLTVPAAELPYFDPARGAYQVARTEPLEITVEGELSPAAAQAQPGENVLDRQIRPIRTRTSVRSEIGQGLWRGVLAPYLLGGPPGLWLLIVVADAARLRLTRETAGTRRRRARRTARRRMRVAEYHIKAQRPSAFFGECARVIYEHLEYVLGQKVEALTLGELRGFLEQKGFSKETAEMVVKELETCDFARFAPSASGPGEMRAALRRVRTLLGWIEKVRPIEQREAA